MKGKTSTIVLSIIIILLIGGIAYFAIKNNELEIAKKKNESSIEQLQTQIGELQNTINEEGKENSNMETNTGEKLLQFDNEFYNLKDVALEYRMLSDIKNYKDFEYDLDGDGIKDKITIKHETEKVEYNPGYADKYFIQLNGNSFLDDKNETIAAIDSLYIVDLNKNDNKIEVVYSGNGLSDDPYYIIFSKENSKMKKIVEVGGYGLKTDKVGNVVIGNELTDGLKPRVYDAYYNINNGTAVKKTASLDAVKNVTISVESVCFTQDKNSLKKYIERDYSNEELGDNYDEKQALEKYGIYFFANQKINFNLIGFESDKNYVNRSYKG